MSSLPTKLRGNTDLIALNLALLLVASVVASGARALYRNSLAAHPEWIATKAHLPRAIIGAPDYVAGPQAVARNRLNLAPWFGFHEVLYHRPLDLTEMTLDVGFKDEGYVNVLYDVRPDGFSGVRFSSRTDLPSTQFRAAPGGGFISQHVLEGTTHVAPNRSHAIRLRFDSSTATVGLDDRVVGAFPRTPGAQRIGFRGGLRSANVDDISLHLADGTTVRETLANTRHRAVRISIVFGVACVVMALGALVAHTWFAAPARAIGLSMLLLNLCLIIGATGMYLLEYLRPEAYHRTDAERQRVNTRQVATALNKLVPGIRRRYSADTDRAYRILFLGSSQTFGEGASAPEDVWVRQLERMLNAEAKNGRFECINAGVAGLLSPQVLEMARALISIRPQAVVINLSNNDRDTATFRTSMESMVSLLTSARITTVLLLEPNSPERRATDSDHGDLAAKHRIVRGIGQARGVPVIDMHSYLASRNRSGFLWWDFVHLTSFGQQLVAEKLSAELPALLHLDVTAHPAGRAH